MAAVRGIAVLEGEIREVPKLGLNLEEVIFAMGSHQLVADLREIGALVPIDPQRKVKLFSARHVTEVWEAYEAGTYQRELEILRR